MPAKERHFSLYLLSLIGARLASKLSERYGDIFDICSASMFTGEGYRVGEYHQGLGEAIKGVSG